MSLRSLLAHSLWAVPLVAAVPLTSTVTVTAPAVCSSPIASNSTSVTASPTTSYLNNENPTGTTLVATATATNYGLNDAAKAAGKLWFGTAADIPQTGEITDPYYLAQFNNTHDFGEATPGEYMNFAHKYHAVLKTDIVIANIMKVGS